MRFSTGPLATAAIALLVVCTTVAAAAGKGAVRGEVTDTSGGVLPGVTVVASAVDGRLLATAVTDGSGGYVFDALPAGRVTLRFQIEGFASVAVGLTVQSGAESRLVQRLELASLSETVVVLAPAEITSAPPVAPPPPPAPVVRPVLRSVPIHDRDSICGPAKAGAPAESLGTIRSGRYGAEGGLYATGAEIIIDGGLLTGLDVGQNLVVRHYFLVRGLAGADAKGEHSAGLLQIVAAGERFSVAVVVYACDELRTGDFLASFKPEPIRMPDPLGVPAYLDAARILFADEGQVLGVPRRLMVIDRGSELGVRAGQRLTLFRRPNRSGAQPDIIGDAVVVAVRTDSATIRIERIIDAISSGDWAAPQRPAPVARQSPRAPASDTRRQGPEKGF